MIIDAHIENLALVLDFLRKEGQKIGMDKAAIQQLELATEEALVNIIEHGYRDAPGKIEVLCEKVDGEFQVTLIDQAQSFDVQKAEVKHDPTHPLQQRENGGLGILFMRKFTDRVEYSRVNDSNRLLLAKKITSS